MVNDGFVIDLGRLPDNPKTLPLMSVVGLLGRDDDLGVTTPFGNVIGLMSELVFENTNGCPLGGAVANVKTFGPCWFNVCTKSLL